jgi:8-oxo-dGTP pyrophosphatase MutT (NUDIX family)
VLELSDQETDAKPAATVILIRPAKEGVEVLLLKRSEALKHMPGLWVFPGGKVEAGDSGEGDFERARSAAARECHEEAGVALRSDMLAPFSHWLTPVVVKRRFATWFFWAQAPADTAVQVDDSEITAHQWWQPAQAIAAHHAGELPMTPPTLVSLHDLDALDRSACAATDLATRTPPTFFPKVIRDDEQMVFLYEGDVSYGTGDLSKEGIRHRTVGDRGVFRYQRSPNGH